MSDNQFSTEIGRYEQSPDIYGGASCAEMQPRWIGWADGDKEGPGPCGDKNGDLVLDCKRFPPGTIVTVSVPLCPNPECDLPADEPLCPCGFDWLEWARNRYS